MTIYELMVIAVAAGVFMIINIIMWSVISHKEKKAAAADNISLQKAQNDFIIEENILFVHTDEML
ncbi:MAG TPA: hypothetical protein P5191_03420 [Ruminococcus sp.]|nr:hypothetical protein [Ruminococcus sp.]HRR75848.1 hypothetical protein [Ruminococcus sp.]